jgi:hypothetical protein
VRSSDSIGYELCVGEVRIAIFDSLDMAKQIATHHIEAGRALTITALSASIPSVIWQYDFDLQKWGEPRPYGATG